MADWANISRINNPYGSPYGSGSTGTAGFQAFGGGQAGVGGAGTPSATPQDLVAKFDAMDARALTGSTGAAKGTSEIPATSVTGAQGATNPFEVTQVASAGKIERPGDKDGLPQGELNPVVANNELANKLQYFA